MLACLDVDYRPDGARGALLTFEDWESDRECGSWTHKLSGSASEYQPGRFFLRELASLLALLELPAQPPGLLLVDGYAWLGPDTPGLGAHLYRALQEKTPVIGVAKNPYRSHPGIPVWRGGSRRPLWVTAAGWEAEEAARAVTSMHGEHRIPTLLKKVDQLARTAL